MAAKNDKKEGLVHQPEKLASRDVPEHLKQYLGNKAGMEEVRKDDLIMPRLGLCQSLSPQKKKSSPLFITGLEDGQLFNTITNEVYGESVQLVPLFFFRQRIKFHPLEEGGGIDCQSLNGKDGGRLNPASCLACPHSQWGAEGKKPECSEFKNFMAIVYPSVDMIVFSTKSTSLKIARTLNTLARLKNMPLYTHIYEIGHAQQKNAVNEWEQFTVRCVGPAPQEFIQEAEHYFSSLRDTGVQVDIRGMEGEDPEGTKFDPQNM